MDGSISMTLGAMAIRGRRADGLSDDDMTLAQPKLWYH